MDLLAAAGQRLLLQAVAPAPEEPEAAPAAAAAPATAVDGGNGTEGYQVLLRVLLSACRRICCASSAALLPRNGRPCRRVARPAAACSAVPEPPPPGLLCRPRPALPAGLPLCLQVSFGTSSCTNASGPICYNTAISGENLLTGWVPACLR